MATATAQGAKTEAGKAAADERVKNQGSKPKAERKILTPEERVKKLEAELAEARKTAEAKAKARLDKVRERRESVVKRVNPLITELNELNRQLDYPVVDLVPVATEG